ncbi:MAG: DNA mismatch repair protein MutS [Candidatus Woesearchaeota archaeon]
MKLTPAMRQYMQMKDEYPDAIILFRMGDFYECFYDDAIDVSQILGITLTSRGKDESKAPLAGIPYHSLDKYLKGLVESGRKIAICEQLEDPKKAKGVVKRGIVRVVTPGTVVEDSVLHDRQNNYLVSLFLDEQNVGFACCDISTGEFQTCEFATITDLIQELARFSPSEIIVPKSLKHKALEDFTRHQGILLHHVQTYYFYYPKAEKIVLSQFQKETISQLGLSQQELAICASGGLLQYLQETQKIQLSYIDTLKKYTVSDYMQLDKTTLTNLEITKTIVDQKKHRTLLATIDKTKTSMGARLLKKWIVRPLIDITQIRARQSCVDFFCENQLQLEEVQSLCGGIVDLERLLSRLTYGQGNGRDLVSLKNSLSIIPQIYSVLDAYQAEYPLLAKLISFHNVEELVCHIDKAIKDECPVSIREGRIIRKGYNTELDELWDIKNNATTILSKIEQEEIQKTGISTLKIKYNKVFGYYIEVTNRFKDKVPDSYIRKQSTVNSERFITEELKELEEKIISAQDKIHELEYSLFQKVVEHILTQTKSIQENAQKIAELDCLMSFAQTSIEHSYVLPELHDGFQSSLKDSRHPVVEQELSDFVPNDCAFTEDERMMIITGPNMAGKSTFMRQIALIQILAQIGCFVPARQAKMAIVDKIFTRVGAYDDVSQGQSTFMVEMSETAHILQNATEKSFIIFDEIGSGTSTYDGVSLAWAVALDLAKRIQAKTVFATHYHVLTKLEEEKGVVNYNIAVLEKDDEITFLRKIVRGGTDKSYGIHVAKLAGLPSHVIENARKIQLRLEEEDKLHKHIVVEKRLVSHTKDVDTISYAKLKQQTLEDIQDEN